MYRIKGFVAVKLDSTGLQLPSLAALCATESERPTLCSCERGASGPRRHLGLQGEGMQ